MENFVYHNPVKLVFGRNTIAQLAELIPANARILMVYGGGSIKKNGVYEQTLAALAGRSVVEFQGIEVNPTYETCMEAVAVARREKSTFLLAVGGGSVLDAVKFIAAALHFEGSEPWDILAKRPVLKSALPLGAILTLPATGSEMNINSVISRRSTSEKLHFSDPAVYPVFSILDPSTTTTLPERQTINGVVDALVHVLEQYMTNDLAAPLQDRQAEAIIATLIEQAPLALKSPNDYDVRANIMWAATNALNGWIGLGVAQDWATHMIGHELTAFYGMDHAQSLAIVMPQLWRVRMSVKKAKLAQLGRRVFALTLSDPTELALATVGQFESFLHRLGMKTTLKDLGIEAKDAAEKVSSRFLSRGDVKFGEDALITAAVVREILLRC